MRSLAPMRCKGRPLGDLPMQVPKTRITARTNLVIWRMPTLAPLAAIVALMVLAIDVLPR